MIRLSPGPFDPAEIERQLRSSHSAIGAVVSFVGQMRDFNDDRPVTSMYLEHYPGMTEKALAAIVAEAEARWPLLGVEVVHRVGDIALGDTIVLVAVASRHRREAFQACELIIDYLKTQAPFWKREQTPEGARWVESRSQDEQAAASWHEGCRTLDPTCSDHG